MKRFVTSEGPAKSGKQKEQFSVPSAFHWLIRGVSATAPLFVKLGNLESRFLESQLATVAVDRPIYICGLSRVGTTISAQMLSEHPDATTHRYSDFLMPYLPWCWNRLWPKLPINAFREPVERIHRDRLMVTRDSAEDVEEMIWERFFGHLHNGLDESHSNPAFERFFTNHIRKLLLVRGRSRYVTKSILGVSRLRYLRRVFPDIRVLLYVRNPVDHIASMLKQDRIWEDMHRNNPRQIALTKLTGHHGFGPDYVPLNVTDEAVVNQIYRCRMNLQHTRARALHWASVYGAIMKQLTTDPELARAVCVVRYEDLCNRAGDTIDRILGHAGLSSEGFGPVRDSYIPKLSLPSYYRPDFSGREMADIAELTRDVAEYFGYAVR